MFFVCPHASRASLPLQNCAPSRRPLTNDEALSRTSTRIVARSTAAKVVVIGGGAAGLTAASWAAKSGAQVTVLEKTKEAGRKVLISGGTRCNVLPVDVDLARDYFSESSPSALGAIFASWSLQDCKEWLEGELGLELACETSTGKYFPVSNSGKDVRDRLLAACSRAGVHFRYNASLKGLQQNGESWECLLADGSSINASRLVMATGGCSFPALGTDGEGLSILAALGHGLHAPYPALTPLKGPHVAGTQLAGLSLYTTSLQCAPAGHVKGKGGRKRAAVAERSAMLFTHRGFSGPAVLDLSHHLTKSWDRGLPPPAVEANWTGEAATVWEERLQAGGGATVSALLRRHAIPQRLADALSKQLQLDGRRLAELKKNERMALVAALTRYNLQCSGHEGYAKAEVTGGGVPLEEVNCATMESRRLPGVYLCGELLDTFGRIGGFNFYWAWLTGRLAGLGAAR